MTDSSESVTNVRKFPVTSIEKSDPPEGVTEGEWYEYVIGEGTSEIKGKRSGSLKAVTEYVKEYAANLDERSTLGYSAYAARKPVKQPAKPES